MNIENRIYIFGGATELGIITLATRLAPTDASSSSPRSHRVLQQQPHQAHVLLSHTTDATPHAVGLHCVQPVTNLSVRYLHRVQCVNPQATTDVGEVFAPSIPPPTYFSSPVPYWTEYNKNNRISYRNIINTENLILFFSSSILHRI
jgi:hypothetical protein